MNIPFKNSFLSWMMKKRIHQIDFFRNNPNQVQDNVFQSLIENGKHTMFGKEHNFRNINSYYDFSRNVPVRTYEQLFPYIEKTRKGEKDVLWPGKVSMFAKSSGTTNDRSKYIPVTEESLKSCHFKGGKDMLSMYCNNFPNTRIFNGKGLMLGGSKESNTTFQFTDGDLSALLIDNFPFWVNMHRVPDLKTSLMKDWDKKLEKMCEQSLNSNVTNITGVPSWMLVLFHRMIERSGAKDILEIWPNLELFMHGGVNFGPYINQFEKFIPSEKMNYLEGYNASEGFFGIQDEKDSNDLLLMLDYGIFYEFIPLSEYNKENIKAIPLADVKLNEVYVIIISTNGGLWRYIIGDTIRFISLNPYRIKIVGRTKSFLNSVGEELVVENTELAIKECSLIHKCSVSDYIATSVFVEDGIAQHKWIFEFKKEPNSKKEFMNDVDNKLREINSDYDAKRSEGYCLLSPEIILSEKGIFTEWLRNNNRLGGQYKVPRLDNSTKVFHEILKLNTTY
ncbi:MAG TPA: GH3 auxin-responsive promoter family protein [Flavobacteriales bacterium]|nr:GH3 auxin-responsive promoter family protein [Flavobacteriales bacterium]